MEGRNKKVVYASLVDSKIDTKMGVPTSVVYRIDPYSSSGRKTLDPVLTKPNHKGYGFTSFGSKLYAIGGDHELKGGIHLNMSNTVLVFETTKTVSSGSSTSNNDGSSSMAWEITRPTVLQRLYPVVVPVKDRLFVFTEGKIDPNLTEMWAEVFRPSSSNNWSPVHPIPFALKESALITGVVVLEDEEVLILVTQDKGVYRLDYSTEHYKWGVDITPLSWLKRWTLRTAVVGQVIYVYRHDSVVAYDRDENKWFDDSVQGLTEFLPSRIQRKLEAPGSLLHLGENVLFLVWAMRHRQDVLKMELHWVRFRVSKIKTCIHAYVEANGIYDVDGQTYYDACTI